MSDEKTQGSGSGSGTALAEVITIEQSKPAKEPVCVVYPYLKSAAQGEELKLSLRSLEKNFREDFVVVIVGDFEPWMSKDILVIPSPGTSHKDGDQPMDIALKLTKVIEDARIPENFVWMNDDIYFINPVMLADIQILKSMQDLAQTPRDVSNPYRVNLWKTYDKLKELGKSLWNYGTHLPFWYNKAKLAELIDKFNLQKESYLISTLYHNYFFPEFRPMMISAQYDNMKIGLYKPWSQINKPLFEKFLKEKKFLNNSQIGYNEEVMAMLKKMFPKKSRFEK